MKPRLQKQRNRAFTLIELLVIVVVLAVLAIVLLPMESPRIATAQRINCINNLKQINLNSRLWEGDNNNQYPMSYTTNGVLGWPATMNIAVYFQSMSNELKSPQILFCPADREHVPATNWTTDFNNSHISYFLNPDASEAYPQEITVGDDNLAINGVPVKSGLLYLSPIGGISWTTERHGHVGNLGFADGSVAQESSMGLQNALQISLQGTPVTTNRIVIP